MNVPQATIEQSQWSAARGRNNERNEGKEAGFNEERAICLSIRNRAISFNPLRWTRTEMRSARRRSNTHANWNKDNKRADATVERKKERTNERKKEREGGEGKKWRMMISRHTMTLRGPGTHANAFVQKIVIAGNDRWWFSDPMIPAIQQRGETRYNLAFLVNKFQGTIARNRARFSSFPWGAPCSSSLSSVRSLQNYWERSSYSIRQY